MTYSSVDSICFEIPAGPVMIRLTILKERFPNINRSHYLTLVFGSRLVPPSDLARLSYLVFFALDLTEIWKVWLTKAGRFTP